MKRILGLALCLAIVGSAGAQERTWLATFQDWQVYAHPSGTFVAETVNDSGATFGVVCRISDQWCFWAVISNSRCVDDGRYPILANASAGAFQVTGHCFGRGQNYTMELEEFDLLQRAITAGTRIGFAVPLENGLFHVTRFSLAGAIEAAHRAADLATSAGEHRTDDMVL